MNLTMGLRKQMPSSSFALPGKRFPISDPTHARLAIGGATRAEHAGNISPGQMHAIQAKARQKLGMSPKDALIAKLQGGR
jgi:hypothetical protein